MAKLDKLIETLIEQGYPIALIHPNAEIMVDTGGGEQRPLGSRTLSSAQIEMVIDEIISDEDRRMLRDEGRIEVTYASPAGSVEIMAFKRAGSISVYVRVGEEKKPATPKAKAPESSKKKEFGRGATGKIQALGLRDDEDIIDDPRVPAHKSQFGTVTARPRKAQSVAIDDAAPVGRSIPMLAPGTAAEIDKYLRIMFEEDCSDLHLSSGNPPLFRKDGDIAHLRNMPTLGSTATEQLILPIMPDRNYEEFVETRDTDFAYEIPGIGRFRVNVFMDRRGPGAVFRIIPDEILTAEQLNLEQKILDLCYLTKGLVVVTGPTGSGKSTTLAAMIDYINRNRAAHIITIEDPIEFVHPNKQCLINQREVGVHTMGFKPALRAALREDPDIVLVGEMRDLETISIAIETAETGHLVFGTLHTNTAPSTVDRIIDQFPPDRQSQVRTMLSESLKAVIAQTLCKKVGGGRVAALETLMIDHAMANLIREGKTFQIPSMMGTKRALGNMMLNDSLAELVRDGKVEPNEAYLKCVDKDGMRRLLQRLGHQVTI